MFFIRIKIIHNILSYREKEDYIYYIICIYNYKYQPYQP